MKLEDLFEGREISPEKVIDYLKRVESNAIASVSKEGIITVEKGKMIIKESWVRNGKLSIKFDKCDSFHISTRNLSSTEGLPKYVTDKCVITGNKDLKSIVGGPEFVGGSYNLMDNGLMSLEGIASSIGSLGKTNALDLVGNNITSLKDIHKHIKYLNGFISLDYNKIEDSILGLLKIKGLKGFSGAGRGAMIIKNAESFKLHRVGKKAEAYLIVMKYLGTDSLFDCQEELIEAGFPELAQL